MPGTVGVEKKKICLIGTIAVGKTSLVQRFVHNRFGDKYLTTIGVEVSQKLLPPVDAGNGRFVQYHLVIWDIAGMDRFDRVVKDYYRGASGALAVADLTRIHTTSALASICRNFRSICPAAEIVFIGNKADLFSQGSRIPNGLQKVAAAFDSRCLCTSAKTGEGVAAAFQMLAENLKGH